MNKNLKLRMLVHSKYNGHCAYCGKKITVKEMQVDHMNPKCIINLNHVLIDGVWEDRTNHIDNLMPTCRRCNHYKRANTLDANYGFRHMMKTLHERIEKQYINKVAIDYGIVKIVPFDGLFYFERVDAQNAQK